MSTKEAKLDLSGSRRRGSGPKAGSVWESRMKLDDVKGGFKVFNENSQDNDLSKNPEAQMDEKVSIVVRPKQSPIGMSGKRKTWKSEGNSPVQIARKRSEVKLSDPKKIPGRVKKKISDSFSDGSENESIKKLDEKDEVFDDDVKNRGLEGCNGEIDKSPVDGVGDSRSESGFVDDNDDEEEKDKEIGAEKKSLDIKEINVPKNNVIEDEKLIQKPVLISSIVNKQAPAAVNHARFHSNPTKNKPVSDNFHDIPRRNGRLQSFVDLVMWRDVSKSAFIFGIGTFGIISSSYTKDLNISFISVISYLGLVYLAAVFLFRSLITRGSMDNDSENKDCVVGEEEAIRVVKLILPYLNEFLLKLRALFSGDPATTMKLAVFLFILAKFGSSITIWKMTRLGFIGVFTVPKICSTYSSRLTAYGTFWIQRFQDAWYSCSHKKAVAFAIFTLVWNLSSVVARICAVFMLFVAFKYYQQQSLMREGWTNEEKDGGQKSVRTSSSTLYEMRKQKKLC
ncbi:hypothetical protein CASFOL_032761 [Castilleja foliolosa]|uniref:Reticulon-like protein n=1 Tax=Castilleja foliolosa TaxID=1961234 RepID=A0ABD3C2F1_9LAMI